MHVARIPRFLLLVSVILAWSGFRSPPALAINYTWWEAGAPNGYWDDSNSWIPFGVPGAGSGALIESKNGGALQPRYRSATSPKLFSLSLDTAPLSGGSVSFTQSQDTLKCGKVRVGVWGAATWTQSGGRSEFDLLRLGEYTPYGAGTYYLQNSGTLVTGTTEVGSSGTGLFILRAAAVHNTDHLWVADGSRYKVEGGRLTAETMSLDADYEQTGGQASIYEELDVNLGITPPAAKVNLKGGTFSAGTVNVPFGTFEVNGGESSASNFNNGAPSLCSLMSGAFSASIVTNEGYFGQSGGTGDVNVLFKNLAGATFMESGGVLTSHQFRNDSDNMTIMMSADLRTHTLDNRGTVKLTGGRLRGPQALPGLFFLCQVANPGTFHMEGGTFSGVLTNDGTFEYVAGDFSGSRLIHNGSFTRSGAFTCLQFVNNTTLSADSTKSITASGATTSSAIENNGTLTIIGNALVSSGSKPIVNKGTLNGTGTVGGSLTNEGTITVAKPTTTGTLSVNGGYSQTGSGDLRLTIAEPMPGVVTCDKVVATGSASLSGQLSVAAFSYTPKKGDEFQILTCTGRAGTFQTYSLPTLNPGLVWTCEYTDNAVVLLVRTPIASDFDGDGDVDPDDFRALKVCFSGPAIPAPTPCRKADLDGDGDIDQSDFGLFQRCFGGPGVPADPGCR